MIGPWYATVLWREGFVMFGTCSSCLVQWSWIWLVVCKIVLKIAGKRSLLNLNIMVAILYWYTLLRGKIFKLSNIGLEGSNLELLVMIRRALFCNWNTLSRIWLIVFPKPLSSSWFRDTWKSSIVIRGCFWGDIFLLYTRFWWLLKSFFEI